MSSKSNSLLVYATICLLSGCEVGATPEEPNTLLLHLTAHPEDTFEYSETIDIKNATTTQERDVCYQTVFTNDEQWQVASQTDEACELSISKERVVVESTILLDGETVKVRNSATIPQQQNRPIP